MEPSNGLAEFYVLCNPPLAPTGVNFVVRHVKEFFVDDEVLELLYEPEIPWFKLITFKSNQSRVSHFICQVLLTVVENDSDLPDMDLVHRARGPDDQLPLDIKPIGPRICAWSRLQTSFGDADDLFDAHRFPADMAALPSKDVWRGLESTGGDTIHSMLDRLVLDPIWRDAGAPGSIPELENLLGCQVSHNGKGNLVYIGSRLGRLTVENAIQTLDNLLSMAYFDDRTEHLIVTEGPGPFRFGYRWLSHIGLDRTTYVTARAGHAGDELRRLSQAVTLRAMDYGDGRWTLDKSNYGRKSGMKPGETKLFHLFDGYQYPRKQASPIADFLENVSQAQQEPKKGSDDDPWASTTTTAPVASATEQSSETLQISEHCSVRNLVESWRDAVEQEKTDGLEELWQLSNQVQGLISFDEPHQDRATSAYALLAAEMLEPNWEPQIVDPLAQAYSNETEDLISFDEVKEPRPDPFRPQGPAIDHDQSLLDTDSPNLAIPSIQHDVHVRSTVDGVGKRGPEMGHSPPTDPPGTQASAKAINGGSGDAKQTTRKSRVLEMAEARVKALARLLPLTTGNVSIELKFGRFYRKNLSHSKIDFGSGPSCNLDEMLESLSTCSPWQNSIGFSGALTTCGPDADDLVKMSPPDEGGWLLLDTRTWYEISCSLEDRKAFIIDMDAETSTFRCRGAENELGCLYFHCVRRPWDMQVCISQNATLDKSRVHTAIAQALVASVSTTTSKDGGKPVIELTADERLKAKVDGISVRRVARYRQEGASASVLSLTMTQRLARRETRGNRETWDTSRAARLNKGVPGLWYEASVSSLRGREMLAENARLRIGEKASWDCDMLEAEGVIEDICRPALGMITQMDHIGQLNHNGLRMGADGSCHDTEAEAQERAGGLKFW
ncbi:hypothetical protein CDD83_7856 [Cordyceps sp. RAO-2017]|nr:hypothetical protein CDD83_7856 [Cordyceps sp. RAO-2017]